MNSWVLHFFKETVKLCWGRIKLNGLGKKLNSQAVLVQLVLFQVLLSMLFFLPDHPMICAKTFIIKPISLQDIFKKKKENLKIHSLGTIYIKQLQKFLNVLLFTNRHNQKAVQKIGAKRSQKHSESFFFLKHLISRILHHWIWLANWAPITGPAFHNADQGMKYFLCHLQQSRGNNKNK